jgi:ATP-dependent DNA ligase
VEILELTTDKHLRAPSFRRLRNDKDVKDCVIEQLGEEAGVERKLNAQGT